MELPSPFSESALQAAIAESICWADALRALGYDPKGHNYRTVKHWVQIWGISTAHFDPHIGRRRAWQSHRIPLEQILVEHSRFHRGHLKERLFKEGIKQRHCELCGQGETWRGSRLSLILDHINGVADDDRLENLRIVCPNCNATLETHCGRSLPRERACVGCGKSFQPSQQKHRYCSQECWAHEASKRKRGVPQPERRKVERPSWEQLEADLAVMSVCAVGRKYGVSDNAVRKWRRSYREETARVEAGRTVA